VSDGNLTDTTSFILFVTEVNDPPEIAEINAMTIDEDTTSNPIELNVSDIDSENLNIMATSSNQMLLPDEFMTLTNNELVAKPAENQFGETTIMLTVSDGNLTDTTSFILFVTEVNDPPEIAEINDMTIDEDTTSNPIELNASDIDSENLNIVATSSNQTLLPDEFMTLTNNELIAKPAENQFGETTIMLTVSDGNLTDTTSFILFVTEVNDPPEIAEINDMTIDEDTTSSPIELNVSDIDSENLSIVATSSNQMLLPDEFMTLTNNELIAKPAENQFGETTIMLTVSDGNLTDTTSFILFVTEVNDPPEIAEIQDLTIDEDTTSNPIELNASDIDSENLSIVATSSNHNLLPDEFINLTNNELIAKPAENQFGETTIMLTVSDGNLTDTTSFILFVTEVNDPPEIAKINDMTIDEDTTSTPIHLTASDIDSENLNIVVTSSNQTLLPDEFMTLTNNELVTKPAENQFGETTIMLTVSDGNLTDTTSFILFVTEVNDPPEIAEIQDLTIDEDTTSSPIELNVSDIDSENLNIVATSSNQNLLPDEFITLTNNELVVKPAENQFGETTIMLTVSDGNLTDTTSFILFVTEVNDPPKVSDIPDQSIHVGEQFSDIDLNALVNDVDHPINSLKWSFVGANELSVLISEQNIVSISPSSRYWKGSETIKFIAVDPDGLTDSNDVTFTIVDAMPPVLTLLGDNPTIIEFGNSYTEVGARAIDNGFEDISNRIDISGTVDSEKTGTYTITYKVTDSSGNSADTQNRIVIVRDTQTPVIQLSGQSEITVNVYSDYSDKGAVLIDNYDGTIALSADDAISDLSMSVIGTYVIIYQASDSSGNEAEAVTRTVHVVDSVKPVIHLNGERITKHIMNTDYNDPTTATDNYDGDITKQLNIVDKVDKLDTKKEGTYIRIYNVSDTSGNKADEVVRHVVVYQQSAVAPEGYIYDESKQPLENVMISLVDDPEGYTIMSTMEGYYQFKPLVLNNSYYLQFYKTGYESTVLAFYGQKPLDDITLVETSSESFKMFTGVCYSNNNPLQGVSVKLTHSDYSVMALSDARGCFTIMYNPAIDTYHLTASKNGFQPYVKDNLQLSENEPLEITLPPKTTILVENIPLTNQDHQIAKFNKAVKMRIKALPQFQGKSGEIDVFPKNQNTMLEFSKQTSSYTIVHPSYESFYALIKADTSEDSEVLTGYYASRDIYFTALSPNASITSVSEQVTITAGEPVIAGTQSKSSKSVIRIPDDGFQGEIIPDQINVTIREYDNLTTTKITGKILEIELIDSNGVMLGEKNDPENALKEIFITLDIEPPVSKEKILNGLYTINYAISPYDLIENGGEQISVDQIHQIKDDYVTIRMDHLSAFGFAEYIDVTEIPSIPKPGNNCYLSFVADFDLYNHLIKKLAIVWGLFLMGSIFAMMLIRLFKHKQWCRFGRLLTILLIFLNIPATLNAENQNNFSITPFVGGHIFEGNETIGDGPVYGSGLGFQFNENFFGEIKYLQGDFKENFYNKDLKLIQEDEVQMSLIMIHCNYQFNIHDTIKPYILAGLGNINIDSDHIDYESTTRLVYGGGLRLCFSKHITFRGEIMHVGAFHEAGNNLSFNAGIMFHQQFEEQRSLQTKVKKKPVISKAQEISQLNEKQPVDDKPEPKTKNEPIIPPSDSDNDGVLDTQDQCPNTIPEIEVDPTGCPLDADNDNIYDYVDLCPNSIKNEIVDSSGCPKDSDNDGIKDSLDKCPNTQSNHIVDNTGCSIDSDGDGINDAFDRCPGSYASKFIDLEGCEFSKVVSNNAPDDKGFYPYTIQIGAYKKQEISHKKALHFQAKGDPTFTSVANIKGDKWYRILFGYYGTKADIERTMLELKYRHFKHFMVRELPYAIQVGRFQTERKAQEMEKLLISKGCLTYRVFDKQKKSIRLLTGAFGSEEKALTYLKSLTSDFEGLSFKVVRR